MNEEDKKQLSAILLDNLQSFFCKRIDKLENRLNVLSKEVVKNRRECYRTQCESPDKEKNLMHLMNYLGKLDMDRDMEQRKMVKNKINELLEVK